MAINIPRSIPMTGPLTFLSSDELYRTNDDAKGEGVRIEDRVVEAPTLGS